MLNVTSDNVHDTLQISSRLTNEEEVVYGDSGYLGAQKYEDTILRNKSGRKIKYKINRHPSRLKKLSKSGRYTVEKVEHAKSFGCAKVERVFGILCFGKTRYRGLEK